MMVRMMMMQRIWNSEKHAPTGGKIRATEFGLGKPLTHPRGAKSGPRNLGSENHLRTHGGQNPGGKIWATEFGLGKPLTHPRSAKSGPRNLDSENHLRTHGGQNPGAKEFGLGKPLTHPREGKIRGAKSEPRLLALIVFLFGKF